LQGWNEWLRGERIFTEEETGIIVSLIEKTNDPAQNLSAIYWMNKARPNDSTINHFTQHIYRARKQIST
jgi:hypothetical protein